MERKDKMPYSLKILLAMMAGNKDAVAGIIVQCIDDMAYRFMDAAHEYDHSDLPFVVASMRMVSNSLYMMMDEEGKKFADSISEHTHCVAVDVEELKKQIKSGGQT